MINGNSAFQKQSVLQAGHLNAILWRRQLTPSSRRIAIFRIRAQSLQAWRLLWMLHELRSTSLAAKEKKWRQHYAEFYREQATFFSDCVLRVLPKQACRVLDRLSAWSPLRGLLAKHIVKLLLIQVHGSPVQTMTR
jgi:hypothetical protein